MREEIDTAEDATTTAGETAPRGDGAETPGERACRPLSPAARRALAEAAERRARAADDAAAPPEEIGGRAGPEPVRYGDWEVKGLATDF